MSINELLSLMPPHAGAGSDVDWDEAERAWGHSFPTDYKGFVGHYGAGAIENFLAVFEPSADAAGRPAGAIADESSAAQEAWADLEGIQGVDASPDRIVAWGADGVGDMLCWLRTEDGPDEWPVLVYTRSRDAWQLHEGGMVEFLLRGFRAEVPGHPFSGTAMWGVRSPRFLTRSRERQIYGCGQDPWA
ncbi:SMI1/KNR4 family protein [Streptomyces sp. NPDC001523]|uniref:SMI1/KNR4 family protein n=1 Tax=Streptomyces sp. NPDC001523 TaxID=3154383 RepID=UPI00331845B5